MLLISQFTIFANSPSLWLNFNTSKCWFYEPQAAVERELKLGHVTVMSLEEKSSRAFNTVNSLASK